MNKAFDSSLAIKRNLDFWIFADISKERDRESERAVTFLRRAAVQGQLLATPTPIIVILDVFTVIANLNCLLKPFTISYVNAWKSCFDNGRCNECKPRTTNFQSRISWLFVFHLIYNMTRFSLIGPMGIIKLEKPGFEDIYSSLWLWRSDKVLIFVKRRHETPWPKPFTSAATLLIKNNFSNVNYFANYCQMWNLSWPSL